MIDTCLREHRYESVTLEKKKMSENYPYRYQISCLLYANVAAINSREISIEREKERDVYYTFIS